MARYNEDSEKNPQQQMEDIASYAMYERGKRLFARFSFGGFSSSQQLKQKSFAPVISIMYTAVYDVLVGFWLYRLLCFIIVMTWTFIKCAK